MTAIISFSLSAFLSLGGLPFQQGKLSYLTGSQKNLFLPIKYLTCSHHIEILTLQPPFWTPF